MTEYEKLEKLANRSSRLNDYVQELLEWDSDSELQPLEGFTREEYRLHLGNMIGIYQDAFNRAYNDINEWITK